MHRTRSYHTWLQTTGVEGGVGWVGVGAVKLHQLKGRKAKSLIARDAKLYSETVQFSYVTFCLFHKGT